MSEQTPKTGNTAPSNTIDDRFDRKDLSLWGRSVDTDRSKTLRMARYILIAVFGFGGVWAATVPLGGAVIASGRVIAEDRNRLIQHLEGGILSELLVREGDIVKEGQVLARLDATQINAQLDADLLQRAIFRAQLARRRAEVTLSSTIDFPTDFDPRVAGDPRLLEGIESQREEFNSLREYGAAKVDSLYNSIIGQEKDIEGQKELLIAYEKQVGLFREELTDFLVLLEQGHVTQIRVNATERQIAQIDANIANSKIAIEKSLNNIESLKNQIEQEQLSYLNTANNAVVEIQQQLNQLESRIERFTDMAARGAIKSPVDGRVFQIAKRAIGEVIRPGDTIMNIFPSGDSLEIEAMVQIKDIERVEQGQDVKVIFPTDRANRGVPVEGKLIYLSSDAVVSEANPSGNYVAHVRLNADQKQTNMLPGNLAEVYIQTDPKTFLQIVTQPFTRFMFKSFKG